MRTYTMIDMFPDLTQRYEQSVCSHKEGIDFTKTKTHDGKTFVAYPHCLACEKRLEGPPLVFTS